MNNIDITDRRLFDFLTEKAEQDEPDEPDETFYDVDSAWKEEVEKWRD